MLLLFLLLSLSPTLYDTGYQQSASKASHKRPHDCLLHEIATPKPPIILQYVDSFWIGAIADCILVPVGVLIVCAVLGLGDLGFTRFDPVASLVICILMGGVPRANQVH